MRNVFAMLAALLLVSTGAPGAAGSELFSFTNLNRSIPDGTLSGLIDSRSVTSSIASLTSLRVKLKLAGEFNGDVYCYLRQVRVNQTNFCVLLNRPGRATTNSFGYPDAGLDVTLDDSAPNGDSHFYRNITTPASGTSLTGIWQPDGRKVDPRSVTEANPRTTTLAAFLNGSGSGIWSLFLIDAESGATNQLVSWELEMSGNTLPPLAWATPASIIYGTVLSSGQLNATSSVPGSFIYSPTAGTMLNVGTGQTLSVTFTPTDANAYASITTNVSISVLKKDLGVAATSPTKIYGLGNPLLAGVVSGVVVGDNITASYSTLATAASPVGAYPITPSLNDPLGRLGNYTVQSTNGILSVTPAATAGLLTSSANPALPGSPITFTCNLAILPAGAGVVDGAVQFTLNGTNAGSPVPVVNATASFTTPLPAGSHAVAALYLGSANLTASAAALPASQIVNTPPIAAPDTIERWPTNGTKVALTALLANDSDADGDALTFVALSATSAQGAAVSLNGAWIVYTPLPGFTNADSFTYSLSDGHGATANGTVLVNVSSGSGLSANLTVTDLGNGSYRIHVDGVPDRLYRIQYASSLVNPVWTDLTSAATDANGILEFVDTPSGPSRFYRSACP